MSFIPSWVFWTNLNGSNIPSENHKTSFPFANSCLSEKHVFNNFLFTQKETKRKKRKCYAKHLPSSKKIIVVIWPARLSAHSWQTPCALSPSLSPFDKMWGYGPMFWSNCLWAKVKRTLYTFFASFLLAIGLAITETNLEQQVWLSLSFSFHEYKLVHEAKTHLSFSS